MDTESLELHAELRANIARGLALADRLFAWDVGAQLASAQAHLDGDVGPWSEDDLMRLIEASSS